MEPMGCPGFQWAGVCAGIKNWKKKDLGLVVSDAPAAVAAVFTANRVKAAPVLLDMERVASGRCRAIVANSGNANCCTGDAGMAAARAMTRAVAEALGIDDALVLVASTGVIGAPMPTETITGAVPGLVKALHPDGLPDFSESILTTDRFAKSALRNVRLESGVVVTVCATAKGAGMIRPDMATMLCFACTDLQADTDTLSGMLSVAVDRSFNRITVDGDTSTNDTVFLLAGGACGAGLQTDADRQAFQQALDEVLTELARMMVTDGEGATKLIEVRVKGARSDADARRVADTVANSSLVKTAFFGQDANWGRIMAAAGRAGVDLSPDAVDIFFDDVQMVKNGMGCGPEAERKASGVLKQPAICLGIDLNTGGTGAASVLTCDLSVEYVKINADYRT